MSENQELRQSSREQIDAVWTQLFSGKHLIYEGLCVREKPYGAGTSYYLNGNKYQEGVFDVKGLLYGREYFPSGQLRFEGVYKLNKAYGPNYPVFGNCYDTDGNMYYSGMLEIGHGGVGYPMVTNPVQFGTVLQSERPTIIPYMWDDQESDET